ncbi:polysaccharide deacetylase family protein [Effusibacillus dendaii]|uniref:NodB homology domain-containing protein n=1 Tax=Effusibacillus dendaii TaxID=2743772 RepID=A0A7I8DAA2_9BACL|nr:polysaccharide deacetylase family protein [Effusibacillus dendaii]BCJ85889.1 hypothetical protein skT53_08740 [Effusibacillus dendaii]
MVDRRPYWKTVLILLIIFASVVFAWIMRLREPQTMMARVPDKMVALTFDDGPDPRFTPAVLQILKARNLSATFFIIGQNASEHPELVQEIAKDGHIVANHSYTHPHLENLTKDQVDSQLSETDHVLQQILGPGAPVPVYFRPPRGNLSSNIEETASEMNKQIILWNVCVENHTTTTPKEVEKRVMKLIDQNHGGVLLAHDGGLDRTLTIQSLPLILDDLKREGYQIVPLPVYLHTRSQM